MERKVDLTGKIFGKLYVKKYAYSKYNHRFWECICDCGNHRICSTSSLIREKVISCQKCSFKRMSLNKRNKHKNNNIYKKQKDMIVGYTKKGEEFYFDENDFQLIKQYTWWINSSGYPVTKDSTRKEIFLHNLVMGNNNLEIMYDHINRKRNDARKCNLRIATRSQNCANINIRKDNTSKIIGVCKHKNKWEAYIQYNRKRKYLGIFKKKEDAIFSRLKAEYEIFGEFSPQKHLFKNYGIGGDK